MATARYSLLAVLVAVTVAVAAEDLVDETVPPPPPSPTSASTSTEGLLPPGTATEPYPESTPVSLEALHQCSEQTKYDTNWELLNAIDVEELLLQFGGPAGQLNDSFPRMDPADLPLVWGPHGRYDLFVDFFERDPFSLSNESLSDNATFVRLEQRSKQEMLRLPILPFMALGDLPAMPPPPTPPSSPSLPPPDPVTVETLSGEVWWRPAELCGYLRAAEYGVNGDPPRFWSNVKRMHCVWHEEQDGEMRCFGPDAEFGMASPAFASSPLVATLVGK